ncbi:lysophospholipase [Lysobacter sp. BMK333-48F3]|uniref:alpha/beta hydrolase n=1 Tax=Lysobacter sp. BMK333-48F3 TaxID=2867962 RepID=UPI001C8B76C4|nr:alpha/beta fold hydrolase [Lysobacter sp. BMK333-48F3]MBX9402147.1 lysophospholipase [Lysobacter sp. BMK333-48F3]
MKPARVLCSLLLATALSACTWHVREDNIVIARPAPAADLAALRAQLPAYRIEESRIDADGAQLYALRFLRRDAVATVLYFGGNGYTVARQAATSAKAYADAPVNFVLVDHRGYGASTGTASLDALLSDAGTVYDRLRQDPELSGLPLIVHGHSLGSFMAGRVAASRRLDGLILESSVTSFEDWGAHMRSRQKLWARMLVRRVAPAGALAGQGNQQVVEALDEPVLFVAGENDVATPPRFAEALYRATPLPEGRKRLLIVPARNHVNAADSPEFRQALSAFLAEAVAPRTAG